MNEQLSAMVFQSLETLERAIREAEAKSLADPVLDTLCVAVECLGLNWHEKSDATRR